MGALSRLRQGFGAPGLRRAIGIAATLLLLTLLSWPAFAAGRPQSRLDATLATRAGQPGVSRVIVRSTGATDVTAKIRAHRGQAGQRLALVDGYVAEVPNDALEALAAADGVAGVHLDRPVGALLAPGAGNGAGNAQRRFIERARLHWRGRRCRGDRLGAHVLARRPGARRRGPRAGRPARRGLCRLHGLDQSGRRQLRPRHARRRHRRGIGSRQRRRVRGRCARCASAGAEGARRRGAWLCQRRHPRARLRRHQPRAVQPARDQPVDWRAGARVVRDRSAHAGRPARRGSRDGRRRGRRQLRQEPGRRDSIWRRHGAGQRAVGADGWRIQPHGHAGPERRSRRRLQLARTDGLRLCRQARPGGARHAHRLAQRRRQRAGACATRKISSPAPAAGRIRT